MVKESRKYIVFFLVTVALFTIKQTIIQRGFRKNAQYAELINIAGRQRMYSQKVAKLFSYYYNVQDSNIVMKPFYNQLSEALLGWKAGQETLMEFDLEDPELSSLLQKNEALINELIGFYDEKMLQGDFKLTSEDFQEIQFAETTFLTRMEQSVARIQYIAEKEGSRLSYITLFLAIIFVVLFFVLFAILVHPIIKKLKNSNINLSDSYGKLQAAEEELRSNLEALTTLQNKLEQRERLNRIFVEQSPLPIAMFNREIKLLAASAAWVKDYGFKQDEILERSFYQFYHRAEYYWKESFDKALNGEVVSGSSEKFTTESGEDFWLDWEVRPWFINEDEIGGVLFSFKDVTETKALQIENERYKKDMELSNEAAIIGTWETDLISQKVIWSKITKQIHDLPDDFEPNVSIGLLFYKVGKSRDKITHAYQNAISTGEGFDLELQIVSANNVTKWVRAIGLTEMKDGKCVRVYGTFQDINERKIQEIKIKEEALKMENLLKGSNAGTWEWNIEDDILIFNERWAEICGYKLEELEPVSFKTWENLVHPEDLEKSNKLLLECWETKSNFYELEVRMKHKRGHWVWVYTRGRVFSWTEEGKPKLMFGTHIDITKQKRRSVQLESFISQSPSAVAMFDKNMCYLAASDKWIDEYGLTGEYISGRSIYEVFPNISDEWRALHEACLKGEIKKGTETQFVNSSGKLVWLNWEMKPWKEMGHIAGVIIHTEDVTKERELKAQKDRIQNVLELSNNVVRVGAWEYEIDNDELYWSDVTKEIHEVAYDYKPSLKEAVEFYEEGQYRATMLKVLDDAIKKGESYDVELKIITANEKELWVRAVGKPIFENKKCIKLLGIFMDVDDAYRYNNEEIVVKKNRLQDVNESLMKKNKRLADFAQITSHNLRGPVSNLNSLLNLYEASATKDERDMIVGKVSTVTNYLNDTLNTLVESLAIQETSIIKRKKLFFQDVLDKAIPAFQYMIDDFEINLITDFEKAPSVNYNAVYLESIFQNLISNAIKYRSKKRELEINIKSYKENKYIYLEISDNGLGIDLNKYGDKIFGLNRTFHRVEGSKGIGLYMTKQQVESMGGSITVRSEVDKGTVFIIQL